MKRDVPVQAGELVDYLEAPLRRPLQMIVPFALVVTAAVAAIWLVPRKYKAAAVILFETQTAPAAFASKALYEARRLATVKQDVLSRKRLEAVSRELRPFPELAGEPAIVQIERMHKATSFTYTSSDTFAIEFAHPDPKMAADVANRMAALLLESTEQQQTEQVKGASQFVQSQLDEARRVLEEKEEALRRYKEQHMGTLPEQVSTNLAALQRLDQEKQSVELSLRVARDRELLLERGVAEHGGTGAGAAAGAPLDPAAELTQLRSQLGALRGRYTDEHPDVRVLQARIERLQKLLAEQAAAAAAAPSGAPPASGGALYAQVEHARLEVRELEGRRAALQREITATQVRLESAPRTEQEIASLSRDFQQLRENYTTLLNKKIDAEMAERLKERWEGDRFRIVEAAEPPLRPFFPKPWLFLLFGVVGGVACGTAVSIFAELMDHSIRSVGQLEAVVPFPVLATIPHVNPGAATPLARLLQAVRRG